MSRLPLRNDWADLDDETLLDVRMSDLPLTIEGVLADRIQQFRAELESRGLRFPLHFYLSDEWFTPDGAAAIAVPFYLRIRDSRSSKRRRCSKSRAANTSGACESCATRRDMRSTMPTVSACGASAGGCLVFRQNRT